MYFLVGVLAITGLLVLRKTRRKKQHERWVKSVQQSHKDYVERKRSNPTPDEVGISLFDAIMRTGEFTVVSKDSDYYAKTIRFGVLTQPTGAVLIYNHSYDRIETLQGELLLDVYGNIREMNSFTEQVKQAEQKYHLLNCCSFSECLSDTAISYFDQWYASRHQQAQYETPRSASNNSRSEYFSGCNNRESLKKRYYQLSKIYHPDANGGSREIFEKITAEYQNLQRMYA